MAAPLSAGLRNRFASLIMEGFTAREAAHRLQVSAATGVRWARQVRACGCVPIARPYVGGKVAPYVGFF